MYCFLLLIFINNLNKIFISKLSKLNNLFFVLNFEVLMKFILSNKLIYRYMYSRDMYDDKLGIMYNVLFERMKLVKRYGV